MKNIKDVLSDSSPKNLKKLDKAFSSGEVSAYREAFIAEALRPSAVDFPALKCIVTDNFVCDYTHLVTVLGKDIQLVPLNKVKNAYRTNMDEEGKYSHDWFWLLVETEEGARFLMSPFSRNTKGSMEAYQGITACIRDKKAMLSTGGGN